ncbi:MAG: hypothetical protein WCH34_04805 [Bacteroidota bacterium]
MENELLNRAKTSIGTIKYYFDAKTNYKGEYFIVISEVEKKNSSNKGQSITVYNNDIKLFFDAFRQSRLTLRKNKRKYEKLSMNSSDSNTIYYESKANYIWDEQEDKKLELLYKKGLMVPKIAFLLEKPTAKIYTRIIKLELHIKYNRESIH